MKKSIVEAIRRLAPHCRIVNYYGTTETPQGMSFIEYTEENLKNFGEYLPIGQGIKDVQVVVTDELGRKVSKGEIGNIIIRTKYLAKAYLSEDTDELIPISEEPYVYDTGDVGRYLQDGMISILGRRDNQIKRYGHRIELGEIEGRLEQYQSVISAKAIFYQNDIYAFVVAENGFDAQECNHYLAGYLATYMMPNSLIQVSQIPVTANGKVDTKKLENMVEQQKDSVEESDISTEFEKKVYAEWKATLNHSNITKDKTFFEVGGTSMKLLVLQQRLEKIFSKEINVTDLFAYPTIQKFAKHMEQLVADEKDDNKTDEWSKSKQRSKKASVFMKRTNKKR